MRENQAQIETGQTLVYFDGHYIRDPVVVGKQIDPSIWEFEWTRGHYYAFEEKLFNITTEEGISSLVAGLEAERDYCNEMILKYDHVVPSGEIHPTMFEAMKIFMPK